MHLSDPSSATNHATAMPGTLCEAPNSFAAAPANLKKRKRDAVAPSQGQEPTAFVPSSIQHLNAPFYSGPQDVDRLMSGSKCLLATEADLARPGAQPALAAKRRRLMQQQQQQQEQWPGVRWSAPQGKLYPLNTSLNVPPRSSPPVSPKTIPEYDQHVLRPCHICHRRPTTREVLDAYADCDRCGERACYICLRECTAADCGGATPVAPDAMDDGPLDEPMAGQAYRYGERIKRRRVCAWCAVEGLTDSGVEIVRCLDCVRGVASNIPRGP